MAGSTSIEWTEASWNPVTGCTKTSPGCENCYAERMALRLKAMGQKNYRDGFKLAIHRDALRIPFSWKRPRTVFVNSMSDLFHEDIPLEFILAVFEVMNATPHHTYQMLTKRSERLLELSSNLDWADNIWMGVSVENQDYTFRIDHLREVDTAVRFISFEPLLNHIHDLNLNGIDWAIAGGESGPGARPMKYEWVTEIRDKCVQEGVPFFFKQWGGVNKKKAGRLLEGRTWDQIPLSNVSISTHHVAKEAQSFLPTSQSPEMQLLT